MKTLNFSVYDGYAIPYDLDTYKTLRELSIYSTKINESYLSCIKSLTKCKIKTYNLQKQLSVALDKTDKYITSKVENFGKLQVKSSSQFIVYCSLTENNKLLLKKVESTWKKFFSRWGFHFDAQYDETATRCKLSFSYAFTNQPEIEISDESIVDHSDTKLIINGVIQLALVKFEGKTFIEVKDLYADKVHYNLECSVSDSGMLAKLIEFANS